MFAQKSPKSQAGTEIRTARPRVAPALVRPPWRPATGPKRLRAQTGFLPFGLRAKLVVGPASDPLEREADRVAEQVMRMPDASPDIGSAPPRISRACAACEAEEADEQTLRPKAAPGHETSGDAPALVEETLRGTGRPLDPATRSFFEGRFGRDFSAVRIHSGAGASRSAEAIGARAYTLGGNVVLRSGEGSTGSDGGMRLLAHELTHVVQQGAAPAPSPGALTIQRAPAADGVIRRVPGDGMVPPGDCTQNNYDQLSQAVAAAKQGVNALGRCRNADNCNEITQKTAAVNTEINARVALGAACFKGGDSGHIEQTNNKVAMRTRCQRFFATKRCV